MRRVYRASAHFKIDIINIITLLKYYSNSNSTQYNTYKYLIDSIAALVDLDYERTTK